MAVWPLKVDSEIKSDRNLNKYSQVYSKAEKCRVERTAGIEPVMLVIKKGGLRWCGLDGIVSRWI